MCMCMTVQVMSEAMQQEIDNRQSAITCYLTHAFAEQSTTLESSNPTSAKLDLDRSCTANA